MKKQKHFKKENSTRQQFLHTFFDKEIVDDVKEINGFVLHKHFNGNTGGTEIAIYTQDSWERYNSGESKDMQLLRNIK